MQKLVFVADDDRSIRELVKEYLRNEGFAVETFDDGISILEEFSKRKPDMVIIDIMMPGTDGLTVCRNIRQESDIPIMIISAKDDETDRILGLELGSDDYLSKPFSPRELVIRAKNIFNRLDRGKSAENDNTLEIGDITISVDKRLVQKDKKDIEFTVKELDLIIELAGNKGRVFTRGQLIRKIWGYEFIGETRAIDDLVKRIRKKLKEAGSCVQIETVWGYGYKAVDGDAT